MLPHITHDGYTEYDIPLALQNDIDAADTIAASAEAKRVPHDKDNLIIYRYPDDPENGTRKETFKKIVDLFYPMVADWPGKQDAQFEWKFHDIRLERGGVMTPINSRNVVIPRPLPCIEKSVVTVLITKSKSREEVNWVCSKAYLLDTGNSIFVDSRPCRMWIFTFRYIEKDKEEVSREAEEAGSVG